MLEKILDIMDILYQAASVFMWFYFIYILLTGGIS